jgi:hypothetical protein
MQVVRGKAQILNGPREGRLSLNEALRMLASPKMELREVESMNSGGLLSPREAAREMRSRAAEIKKRNPDLDDADALSRAMDENPDLASKYRELRNKGALGHEPTPAPNTVLDRSAASHQRSGNRALRGFSGVLEEVRKERPNLSESAVWAEAHRRRPDLYAAASGKSMS